ncbi:hypothetical protein [Falsiroseomonas ponticola]|uniref:hypothetical protein n=1 Tax=Falsiroseomonas ponticola TaxID=2786951 RepID=UPI00193312F4|nr:hypothetical protein [Roseomonas ponticola]
MKLVLGAAFAVAMTVGGALAQPAAPLRVLVEQRVEDGSLEERATLRCVADAPCLAPTALVLDGRPVATLLAVENLGSSIRLHVIPDLPGQPVASLTPTGRSGVAVINLRQASRMVRDVPLHINADRRLVANDLAHRSPPHPVAVLRVTVTLE